MNGMTADEALDEEEAVLDELEARADKYLFDWDREAAADCFRLAVEWSRIDNAHAEESDENS